MQRKFYLVCVLVLLALLLTAIPALGGGWAVITVDELPDHAIAGETLELRFAVRQHGRHLLDGLEPKITLTNDDLREEMEYIAVATGKPGHYLASLVFPTAGRWRWQIEAFGEAQPLFPLQVLPGPAADAAAASSSARGLSDGLLPLRDVSPVLALAALGMVAASFFLGIITLLRRSSLRHQRWIFPLLIIGLVLGGASIASAANPRPEASPKHGEVEDTLLQNGAALFVAKGCVTCHLNRRLEPVFRPLTIEFGPDLTEFTAAPEYLRLWLADPASVKPKTEMPNLELSAAEIEALVAYVNQGSGDQAIR